MAEECQQKPLEEGFDPEVSVELPQNEALPDTLSDPSPQEIPASGVVHETFDSSDSLNAASSFDVAESFPEYANHLTDHSYIHPLNPIQTTQSIESNSLVSVSDNSLKIESDSAQNEQLPPVPVSDSAKESPLLEESFPTDDNLSKDDMSLISAAGKDSLEAYPVSPAISSPVQSETVVATESTVTTAPTVETPTSVEAPGPVKLTTVVPQTLGTLSKTIIRLPVKQTNAPLGSVKNPIQIIQNGSSFHSTQVLSPAQLQQIALVLQRQQAQKALQSKSNSVMFDPSTNTRIVCRIVHPSELQAKVANTNSAPKPAEKRKPFSVRGRGRPRKSRRSQEEGNSALSKEEREEKKKHRPRTRSGRISKPPSYMVKDYKRIHHLDFNEEPYDDSDGGYSDFQVSDDEEKRGSKSKLPPGVSTARDRSYSCPSCSRAYIGRGGLLRHLRLNPSHGKMPEGEDFSTQDENSNSSLASSVMSNSGSHGPNQPGAISVEQPSPNLDSISAPSPNLDSISAAQIASPVVQASMANSNISSNCSTVLKEALSTCAKEDIIKVVLPLMAREVSLWDFFLAKCNQNSDGLTIFEMLKEFEQFLAQMQAASLSCLKPASLDESQGKTIIHISSPQIASALGLETGSFEVEKSDTSCPNPPPVSNPNPDDLHGDETQSFKRKRVDSPIEGLPDQILNDVIHGEGFDLPLTINLTSNPEILGQDTQALSSQLCNSNASPDAVTKALFDLHSTTVVTPSSLSSGCLSAVVNASKVQSPVLLASQPPQKLHSILLRKSQPVLHQPALISNANLPVSGLPPPVVGSVNDFPQESLIIQKPVEMSNATLSLDPQMDIFNSSASTQSVFDSMESVQLSGGPVSVPSTSLMDITVPNYASNPPLSTSMAESIGECCVTEAGSSSLQNNSNNSSQVVNTISAVGTEGLRDYQATNNIIQEVGKAPENPAVLRHLMLPDGQIISVWSQAEGGEKVSSEQFVQSYLPGNLIILQNPDGSLQVPASQTVQTEALHTLATLNTSGSTEASPSVFTSVQPM